MGDGKPKPEVPGGATITYKHGEATKIKLTVKHFVDHWNHIDFVFDITNGVASVRGIEPAGDILWLAQSKPAREHAYKTVSEIPVVDEVERIND